MASRIPLGMGSLRPRWRDCRAGPGHQLLRLPSSPCSEHDLGEDIYDCVPCEDEGDDIYEDIIKVEVQQPMVRLRPPAPRLAHPVSSNTAPTGPPQSVPVSPRAP